MDYPIKLPQPTLVVRVELSHDANGSPIISHREVQIPYFPDDKRDLKLIVQENVTKIMYEHLKFYTKNGGEFCDPRIGKIQVYFVTHARVESLDSLGLENDFNRTLVKYLREG